MQMEQKQTRYIKSNRKRTQELVGSIQETQTTTNAKVERHGKGRTSRSSTNTERIEAIDESETTSELCVAKGEATECYTTKMENN